MALASSRTGSTPQARPAAGRLGFVLAGLVVAAIAAVYASGLSHYLSLDELGRRHALLRGFVHAHPAGSLLIYMGVYLATVVLFLPAMTLLLLAGGFLFGAPLATAAAISTAMVGAVGTFLLARSTLGALLRGRIKTGGVVAAMEAGVSRHAFTCLLTMRMVPIFPFGVVNVVAGFVRMPLSVFCGATLLGLLPPALVYSSLGVGLSEVFDRGGRASMASLATPSIVGPLLGLAALSLAPHLYRGCRARFRRSKA